MKRIILQRASYFWLLNSFERDSTKLDPPAQAVLDQSIASEQLATRTQQQVEVSARAGVSTSLDLSDADQKKFAAQSAVAQARTVVEIRKAEIAASEGKLYVMSHQQ